MERRTRQRAEEQSILSTPMGAVEGTASGSVGVFCRLGDTGLPLDSTRPLAQHNVRVDEASGSRMLALHTEGARDEAFAAAVGATDISFLRNSVASVGCSDDVCVCVCSKIRRQHFLMAHLSGTKSWKQRYYFCFKQSNGREIWH